MDLLPRSSRDEEQLGGLAMRFRSTQSSVERRDVAREYTQTVTRLIRSGSWLEMPAPEDQLPDDWMPKEFWVFTVLCGHRLAGPSEVPRRSDRVPTPETRASRLPSPRSAAAPALTLGLGHGREVL